MAEGVLAVSDHWALKVFNTHRAFLLALDDYLEGLLQECPVLVIKDHCSLFLEKLEQVLNALSTERPVATSSGR
jgi:hypothetical protein